MSYIVLARKWRPMVFEDVIGQEHITRILTNALKNNRVAHAYIFAGPRGVGKTSTARLLAKSVNCENQPAVNPCNECASCKSITEGHSMDVIEIDGASNRGIDEIRNLRENIRFSPASSRYKIYIIDEVHMLTKEAFNALLKTLEEPPPHAIFIFATTEIHRVPLTILSRCQRFDFKRISVSRMLEMLNKIVQAEKINVNDEALLLIARKADGSMRDAESILDQMIAFSSGDLTVEQVRSSLGLIDQEVYFEFTDLFHDKDSAAVLKYASQIVSSGHDLIDFIHGLQEHFRNFLLTVALKSTKILDVADHFKKRYEEMAAGFTDRDLIHHLQILGEAEQQLKYSSFPELTLEMILLKLVYKPASVDLEKLLSAIEKTENSGSSDTPAGKKNDVNTEPQTELPEPKSRKKKSPPDTLFSGEKGRAAPLQTADNRGFSGLEQSFRNFQDIEDFQPEENKLSDDRKPDISEIKAKWPEVIEKIRAQKVALASFLEEGVPYEIQNKRLIIAYDHSAAFHQEHVEKNSRTVEKILNEELNMPLRIGFKSISFKNEGIEKIPRTPEEIIEDIKNKEPIIRKIIDMFDLDDKSRG
ncbi:MAG: DNA polymerase III subunit gamma/tau [Calditrichaeota bacterium]|nr:DNA polymerase III subunit gamma/tau [Calditrichota bacterium]